MVEKKTEDKYNTFDQFSSLLSHIFSHSCNTSKFLSLKDASMEIPPIPIKTLDGEDIEKQRQCRKLNFELHGNVMHQNVRL